MKLINITVLVLTLLTTITTLAGAQSLEQTEQRFIEPEIQASEVTLHLFNLSGDVIVETHDNPTVEIDIHKWFEADSEQDLQQMVDGLKVRQVQRENHIILYLEAPFLESSIYGTEESGFSVRYRMGDDTGWRSDLSRFVMDFTVQVPLDMSLDLSTVNDGQITAKNIQSDISASNVNGGISLENISGVTDVSTVNGSIKSTFTTVPPGTYRFKTINGSIETWVPNQFSAEVSFKSMNGDLYTNFENIQMLPPLVTSTTNRDNNKTNFKIEKATTFTIGNGSDTRFDFDLLNGNATIRKN